MNREEEPIREKLIFATMACIEKGGIHSLTIRSIAKEANVNSAAISYYFGTKKKLIEAAMKKAMDNAMANFEMIAEKGLEPYEALRIFFLHNFEGMVNFPEITKANLYNPFIKNEYEKNTLKWMKGFLEQFSDSIRKFLPETDDLEIKFIILQIVSAMLFPSIFQGVFRRSDSLNLKDENIRKGYIESLLRHYIKSE